METTLVFVCCSRFPFLIFYSLRMCKGRVCETAIYSEIYSLSKAFFNRKYNERKAKCNNVRTSGFIKASSADALPSEAQSYKNVTLSPAEVANISKV